MTELYAGLALVMQEFQILPRLGPILLRTESAFQSLVWRMIQPFSSQSWFFHGDRREVFPDAVSSKSLTPPGAPQSNT